MVAWLVPGCELSYQRFKNRECVCIRRMPNESAAFYRMRQTVEVELAVAMKEG